MKVLDGQDLAALGREVPDRFDLLLEDGRRMACGPVLRLQPSRRLVVDCVLDGAAAVAKLFLGADAQRECRRERSGLSALHRADLPAPAMLQEQPLAGGRLLVVERLTEAVTVGRALADGDEAAVVQAAELLGRLHAAGLGQVDPHLDNFLLSGGHCWLVDGAAVRRRRGPGRQGRGQGDLAWLVAQLPMGRRALVDAMVRAWSRGTGVWPAPPRPQLVRQVDARRATRARRYLAKSLRDSREFGTRRANGCEAHLLRAAEGSDLDRLLAAPDAVLAEGRPLKQGRSATVVAVELDGRPCVLKRYRYRDAGRALRRAPRRSRARRAWLAGHRLRLLGIPTATPLALIERRAGPLNLASWLLQERIDGEVLDAAAVAAGAGLRAALARLLEDLAVAGLVHGDLKLSNFLHRGDDELVLVDLDALRHLPPGARRSSGQRRDRERLLRALEDHPDAATDLRARLDALRAGEEGA